MTQLQLQLQLQQLDTSSQNNATQQLRDFSLSVMGVILSGGEGGGKCGSGG